MKRHKNPGRFVAGIWVEHSTNLDSSNSEIIRMDLWQVAKLRLGLYKALGNPQQNKTVLEVYQDELEDERRLEILYQKA